MYKTSTFSLDHHYVQTNVHFLVWRTFNYPLLLKIILKVTKEERLVLTFLTTTKNPNLPSQYVSFFNITKNLMLLKYWFYMIICVQCKIFNATYQIKKKKSRTPKCCSLLSKRVFSPHFSKLWIPHLFFKGCTGLDMI